MKLQVAVEAFDRRDLIKELAQALILERFVRRALCLKTRWAIGKVGYICEVLRANNVPKPQRNRGSGSPSNVEVLLFRSLHVRPGVEGDASISGLVLLYMIFHVLTPLLCRSRSLRGWWNYYQ